MDQIRDSLSRLAELSDEEVAQLTDSIVAEFESADALDLSPEVVDSMTELAAALDAVKSEKSRREEEAAELSRRRDEAAARVKGESKEADPVAEDNEPDADPATEAAASTPAETESNPATELANAEYKPEVIDATTENTPTAGHTIPDVLPDGKTVAEAPGNTVDPSQEGKPESIPATNTGSADDAGADNTNPEENNGKDPEAPVTAAADKGPDVQAPASHRPKEVARATVSITAGADIPGITAGSTLPNMRSIAEAMAKRMHGMRRSSGGDGEQHTVASLIADYPEDRVLRAGEPEVNKSKIDKVASPAAIVAAGGFCAPLETNYDILGFGVTDRPVRDSLASFNADRGGIRWMNTPVLGDIPTYDFNGGVGSEFPTAKGGTNSMAGYNETDDDGATPGFQGPYQNGAMISVWNIAADEAAVADGGPEKPCFRVQCLGESEAYLEAIPVCLTIGNLMARAFPELIEANNNLSLVTHARFSEQRLLRKIGQQSTQVTTVNYVGAVRDFLNQVDRAAVAYRHRHRLAEGEPMRVIAPTWLKNLMRADLVNAMTDAADPFDLADARINQWFRARNINVTWTIDGEAGQYFNPQGAGVLVDYPTNVVWYIFAEGTFLFLDGGTLDLGLVRDSTLNATNDYKMFVETFEGVAKRGVESLRVTSPLLPNGAVAGTVAPDMSRPVQ